MVLTEAGFDPTIVVGGQVHILGTNARLGQGEYLVAEADEYDRSFLELTPVVAVITNVEADHLDTYRDLPTSSTPSPPSRTGCRSTARSSLCVDDPGARSLLPRIERTGRDVRGIAATRASRRATSASRREERPSRSWTRTQGRLGDVAPQLPGRHNVANALAAIAVGRELSIPFDAIVRALEAFTGVVRRFEKKGERSGVLVVDDYAHHPTEIRRRSRRRARSIPTVASSRSSSRTSSRGPGTSRDSSARARGRRRRRRDGRLSLAREADPGRDGRPGRGRGEAAKRDRRYVYV